MAKFRQYATLNQLAAIKDIDMTAITAAQITRLQSKLRFASTQIDNFTHRFFEPVIATKTFDWQDSYCLDFRGNDLLALTSISDTLQGAIDTTGAVLYGGNDETVGPYYRIELEPGFAVFGYLVWPQRAITVIGTWGYHDEYAHAFTDSSDTVQNATQISASVTSLTVTSASGADTNGDSPRFQVGQIIRMGTEYSYISAISTNTLTIIRGVNGSTAAIHLNGVAIYTYSPMLLVNDITLRYARFLDARDDTDFSSVTIDPNGSKKINPSMPKDITDRLEYLCKDLT